MRSPRTMGLSFFPGFLSRHRPYYWTILQRICSKNSAGNMLEGSALSRLQKRRARARQTEEERIADLARSQRRRLASSRANRVVGDVKEHVTKLPDVKRRVLEESLQRLSSVIDEEVCCVCDCLHHKSHVKLLSPSQFQAILPAMSLRLKAPPSLPPSLVAHYDVSNLVPNLKGLLLSRAGISLNDGQPNLQVCQSCRTSLLSKLRSHPPKFAIANGLYMGKLPAQFADTSVTENAMLNLSQPMHYLSVVRGGKHSCLRSHAYYFRADPAPPAMLLPRDVVSSGVIGVTMVGAMTTAQKAAMYKKFDVRVSRLRAQLDWYRDNNHLYRNIHEQPSWETSVVTIQTRVVVDAADGPILRTTQQTECDPDVQSFATRELDESTWRHNAPQPAHAVVHERDEVCEQSATGLISDFTPVDSTVGVEQALAKRGVVVHRSSGILSDFDPAFWTHAFCDLYPIGRGGLDEPRTVPISLHEYIRYCLRLSSRQFAQHPSFSLVAFDVLARHNALQAIYIKAKLMPSVVANAARVPREVLQEYVEHQQDRLRALSQTHQAQDIPVVDDRLRDLYASLSAGMRAFWGSNEERADSRKEIFSLQLRFGQPTIFFTISPDCSSSFRVGTLAGVISESSLESIESSVEDCLTFTRARLGQIATANPNVCAKYFDIVMSTFINTVLSWDSENGCSRPDPGLFGRTRAFYASTESQSSTGSLHAHMLIWVEEMPSTVSEYYDMCAIEAFRSAVIAYVDSLVASSVPLDMSSCASCGSTDLASTPLKQAAFKKARRGALRPETLHCATCCKSYGADEAIKSHAGRVEGSAGGSIATDETVFLDVASSHSLPSDPDSRSLEAARVARALLYYQHHHWFHAKSCFKVTKRTPKGNVCRMFMPKDCCPHTHWTPENTIQLKRSPGNEYVNTYSPVVNSIFKCNHDVKFLAAGEGPEKAYYMMKYASKPQQSLENPWALHLHAYDKAKERVDGDTADAVESGRRIAQSMCCNLSNPHEVAAPMACLYLLRGSVVYASHKFVKLHIKSVLSAMFQRDEAVDVVLESDDNRQQFTAQSVWQDYILRPEQLEQLDLMTFVSTWERKKTNNGLKFLRGHPQHQTHTLHRRAEERVVVVSQKRLPDVRREDVSESERLRFEQSVMVLFRRFRSSSDLINGVESFGDVFQRWWQSSASKSARLFVEHNNDYYASRELANERNDPETARYRSYEGDTHGSGDVCDCESDSDDEGIDEIDSDYSDEIISVTNQSPKLVSVLEKSDQVAELAARATISDVGENLAVSMDLAQVEQCLLRIHESGAREAIPDMPADVHSTYPDLPTRVSLLERATSRLNHHPNTEQRDDPVPVLNDQPTIHEVSSAFRLNSDQHRMFSFAGEKLLTSLLIGHGGTSQMIAFLGGLPGAGKSRVIGALQCLAEKWKAPGAVATAAYQGVAAQAANGQTIHKLFGWFVDAKKNWVPNQAQRERFAQLKLLILDEISTCDVKILGMVDRSLQILLDRPSVVFGGVHVLLVGDWLQQLPVAGQPAFQSPRALLKTNQRQKKKDKTKAEDDYLLRVRGANAYQAINKVVILTENMRHRNDPLWRGILDKWRWGQYEPRDIDVVNKIAYEENWTSTAVSPKGYCPIIVTSNALRVEFNSVALRAFCKESKAILHRFPAVVTRTHRPISPAQRRSLRNIRDDKTKGMPTMLELALGSTSQCTKNVSPALKLANGTIGTVVGFVAAVEDVVQVQVVNGVPEHTHSLPPEVVFLKLKGFEGQSFLADLPLGVVPVSKRVERGISIQMENRSFSVTIAQVPLVPAYSLTTEKCQGLTVDKMILAPLRHQTRRSPQRSSLYVAVTRVKSLRQLYLMSPLTLAYVSHFKPSEETLAETHRLHVKDRE